MILVKSVQANGRDLIQAHQNQPGLPWQGILATQLFSWAEISHHFSATHPMLFFCNTVLQTGFVSENIFCGIAPFPRYFFLQGKQTVHSDSGLSALKALTAAVNTGRCFHAAVPINSALTFPLGFQSHQHTNVFYEIIFDVC